MEDQVGDLPLSDTFDTNYDAGKYFDLQSLNETDCDSTLPQVKDPWFDQIHVDHERIGWKPIPFSPASRHPEYDRLCDEHHARRSKRSRISMAPVSFNHNKPKRISAEAAAAAALSAITSETVTDEITPCGLPCSDNSDVVKNIAVNYEPSRQSLLAAWRHTQEQSNIAGDVKSTVRPAAVSTSFRTKSSATTINGRRVQTVTMNLVTAKPSSIATVKPAVPLPTVHKAIQNNTMTVAPANKRMSTAVSKPVAHRAPRMSIFQQQPFVSGSFGFAALDQRGAGEPVGENEQAFPSFAPPRASMAVMPHTLRQSMSATATKPPRVRQSMSATTRQAPLPSARTSVIPTPIVRASERKSMMPISKAKIDFHPSITHAVASAVNSITTLGKRKSIYPTTQVKTTVSRKSMVPVQGISNSVPVRPRQSLMPVVTSSSLVGRSRPSLAPTKLAVVDAPVLGKRKSIYSQSDVIVAAKSAPVIAITVPAVGNASGRIRATAVSKTSAIAVISDPIFVPARSPPVTTTTCTPKDPNKPQTNTKTVLPVVSGRDAARTVATKRAPLSVISANVGNIAAGVAASVRLKGSVSVTAKPPTKPAATVKIVVKSVPAPTTRIVATKHGKTGDPELNIELDDDMFSKLNAHNKKFKPKSTYIPQKHSVKDIKLWETEAGRSWYTLTPAERDDANDAITVSKRLVAQKA